MDLWCLRSVTLQRSRSKTLDPAWSLEPENITNRGNWNEEAEITPLTSHGFISTQSHICNHRLIIVLFMTNKPTFMYKISGAVLMLSRVLIPNSQGRCWCSALLVRGRWCSFSQQSSLVNNRRGWAASFPRPPPFKHSNVRAAEGGAEMTTGTSGGRCTTIESAA